MDIQRLQKAQYDLIDTWAHTLIARCNQGWFGKPFPISVRCTRGPRTAILDISANQYAEYALKAFGKSNSATLRQTINWEYTSSPQVFMSGRSIRVEVGWPTELERVKIPLSAINKRPHGDGRWVTGVLQTGHTHLLQLNKDIAHFLFSGGSGGGKSTALRSAAYQLSLDDSNQLVLLDGKQREGLGCVSGCRNLAGPLAADNDNMRAALQWVVNQMEYRYDRESDWPKFLDDQKRIVVIFDEFQELCSGKNADDVIVELLRRITAQARAAKIHLIAGTQSPNLDEFGSKTTRKNMQGRVVFKTENPKASEVALGLSSPSAHKLTGRGDGYALDERLARVQFAWVERDELRRENNYPPMLHQWAAFDPEAMEASEGFNIKQLSIGVEQIAKGNAGETLGQAAGVGGTRRRRLVRVSRELWNNLQEKGFKYVE